MHNPKDMRRVRSLNDNIVISPAFYYTHFLVKNITVYFEAIFQLDICNIKFKQFRQLQDFE